MNAGSSEVSVEVIDGRGRPADPRIIAAIVASLEVCLAEETSQAGMSQTLSAPANWRFSGRWWRLPPPTWGDQPWSRS